MIKIATSNSNANPNGKFNYKRQKGKWLKRNNGTKVTLRKYVDELATIVSKGTGTKKSLERQYIIKAYNAGGPEGIKLWINKQLGVNKKEEN